MSPRSESRAALRCGTDQRRTDKEGEAAASSLLSWLLHELRREGVVFCSLSGPIDADRVCRGAGDVDLLVERGDSARFESVAALCGFKAALDPLAPRTPAVAHWYGLEPATGVLIHLHVHYRLVLGDGTNAYRLPLERLVLQAARTVEGVPIPEESMALMLFVLRKMVKCASLSGRPWRQDGEGIRAKLAALEPERFAADAADLLAGCLPCVHTALFLRCLASLRQPTSWVYRYWLGRKLCRRLRHYRPRATPSDVLARFLMAARLAGRFWQRRLNRSTPWGQCRPHAPREEPHAEREVYTVPIAGTYLGRKELASGGVVIAFVGPDAAGKSTLVRETAQWLGTTLAVTPAHLGKPPSAWLTWLPNILGRGLRWALRRRRTSAGPTGSGSGRPGLWRSLRAVLLAWDRRALALKLRRVAAGGRVVLCDRYPSALVGAMDSARLPLTDAPSGWFNLRTRFARLENRLYREIPPPDIVIRLVVPVEVALERNRLRQIPDKDHETDAYVRHRHTAVPVPRFPSARTIDLDMTQPRRAVAQVLQQTLWRLL